MPRMSQMSGKQKDCGVICGLPAYFLRLMWLIPLCFMGLAESGCGVHANSSVAAQDTGCSGTVIAATVLDSLSGEPVSQALP